MALHYPGYRQILANFNFSERKNNPNLQLLHFKLKVYLYFIICALFLQCIVNFMKLFYKFYETMLILINYFVLYINYIVYIQICDNLPAIKM